MNVFFTSNDGEVWINKTYMKGVIQNTFKDLPNQEQCKHFTDLLTGFLDACVYQEIAPPKERNSKCAKKSRLKEKYLLLLKIFGLHTPNSD
jgi:hypothetical protein